MLACSLGLTATTDCPLPLPLPPRPSTTQRCCYYNRRSPLRARYLLSYCTTCPICPPPPRPVGALELEDVKFGVQYSTRSLWSVLAAALVFVRIHTALAPLSSPAGLLRSSSVNTIVVYHEASCRPPVDMGIHSISIGECHSHRVWLGRRARARRGDRIRRAKRLAMRRCYDVRARRQLPPSFI